MRVDGSRWPYDALSGRASSVLSVVAPAPIVDLAPDSLAGFEAPIRGHHAEKGLIAQVGAFVCTAGGLAAC